MFKKMYNKIKNLFSTNKLNIHWQYVDENNNIVKKNQKVKNFFNISKSELNKGRQLLKENPNLLKMSFTLDKMNQKKEKYKKEEYKEEENDFVSEDILFSNKWVTLKKMLFFDSSDEYFYISRKKNKKNKKEVDAVIIVPFIEKKGQMNIVLIKEYRPAIRAREFSFPAGLVNKEENIVDAAKRELKEETNLDVKKVLNVSPALFNSAGLTDECVKIVYVLCKGIISDKNNKGSENIDAYYIPISSLKELINNEKYFWGAKCWTILSLLNEDFVKNHE